MALCADREKEQWGERASLGECSKAVSGKKDMCMDGHRKS